MMNSSEVYKINIALVFTSGIYLLSSHFKNFKVIPHKKKILVTFTFDIERKIFGFPKGIGKDINKKTKQTFLLIKSKNVIE